MSAPLATPPVFAGNASLAADYATGIGRALYDRARSCEVSGARDFARGDAAGSVRIFLSAVSDEFRDYRDQLLGDLTRHNVEVKVQEDIKDLGSVTLDKLDVYI